MCSHHCCPRPPVVAPFQLIHDEQGATTLVDADGRREARRRRMAGGRPVAAAAHLRDDVALVRLHL